MNYLHADAIQLLTRAVAARILLLSARADRKEDEEMTTYKIPLAETTEMIRDLRTAAGEAGDESMVDMCDRVMEGYIEIVDSDTGEQLTADELGIDATRYVEACCESLDEALAEGHIRVHGRRVYAS